MTTALSVGAAHAVGAAPAPLAQPAIRVRDLVKHYGPVAALGGISFDVARGEMFAFIGPNGAGKSTTIRILTTLLRPTSGTIRVDDVDPVAKPYEVRRRFGIVFQDPSLDDELTACENLDLHAVLYGVPRRLRRERIDDMLERFGLWDRRDAPVKQFSGGMKRRLEVARALLHRPAILFLDEPTLGLDAQSRNQLWTQVAERNQADGTTVFLTTHYMEEAERVAQRVAIVDHGRIVAQGSPAELKDQTGARSLEEAFLALTGTAIREERAGAADRMRQLARIRS